MSCLLSSLPTSQHTLILGPERLYVDVLDKAFYLTLMHIYHVLFYLL